jgi:hypothetical protein
VAELTGKTRHRSVRVWGTDLLVLQVQEREVVWSLIGLETRTAISWRDAKVEDLKEIYAQVPSSVGDRLRDGYT